MVSEPISLPAPGRAQAKIRQLSRVGLGIAFLLIVVIGGWLSLAPLSSAVIAGGTIVVETAVKKVQHSTGGIVSEIYVQDGDHVNLGDPLILLDDTVAKASRDIYQSQVDEMLARQSRLQAEVNGASTIDFGTLEARKENSEVAELMAREQRVFDTRLQSKISQQNQLRERIGQINQEIEGLQSQAAAAETSTQLVQKELDGVRDLYAKNLVSITRVNNLERDLASLQGQNGQLLAEIARARGRIIETELQISQLDTDYRDNSLATLSDTQAQLAELNERLTAAQDQLDRVMIRAPREGIVHELSVHTVGGVVGAGELLMEIIPTADKLVIDAKVAPQDVDRVSIGQEVHIHLHAGNSRMTPDLVGTLTRVSPDLVVDDRTGYGYYTVRVALEDDAQEKLEDLTLIPGMAATIYIQTGARTALEYLSKPLVEQISKTFQER
ncbi:MAG: HlyD family type I secretion periplasmic adaptor subunit [Hyphomicrobiaceae bacterium]|nr:HlyD family type I secretion periplasmic adaptor subunit [Hyphomicrobiaceae bacterium]